MSGHKISVAGWADIQTVRAARRLAKQRRISLAEYVATAITAAVAHDEAEPQRLAEFTATATEQVVAAVAAVGGEQ